jgi:hypothetical protein
MKIKFAGVSYHCSSIICLWVLLALINLMFLPSSAFAVRPKDFTYTESGGTITITQYAGTGGNIVIPAAIDGKPVAYIQAYAFYDCSGLTSITIPNSVTRIGDNAFAGCSSLNSITIPDSVTSIGDAAFYYCSRLTKAYFYGIAPSMGFLVFDHCASNFTVCYTAGSTGFTNPWHGYTAVVCE